MSISTKLLKNSKVQLAISGDICLGISSIWKIPYILRLELISSKWTGLHSEIFQMSLLVTYDVSSLIPWWQFLISKSEIGSQLYIWISNSSAKCIYFSILFFRWKKLNPKEKTNHLNWEKPDTQAKVLQSLIPEITQETLSIESLTFMYLVNMVESCFQNFDLQPLLQQWLLVASVWEQKYVILILY